MSPYDKHIVIVRFGEEPIDEKRLGLLAERFGKEYRVIETQVPSDQRVTQAEVIAVAFEHRADYILLECQTSLLTRAALAEALPERVILARHDTDGPREVEPPFQSYVVLRSELEVDEF